MQAPKQVAAHQENSTNQDIVETLYMVNKGSKTKALIELIQKKRVDSGVSLYWCERERRWLSEEAE